jgi:16S rRNA (guanine527-N7)-methyltransferase
LDIDSVLKQSLKKLGIDFYQKQIRIIKEYLDMVHKFNKEVNLTGTKRKEDILVRHLLDSISILKFKEDLFYRKVDVKKILDVGTGAGLPGMLLSIFLRDKLFYLVDKKEKKIEFLNLLADRLKIKNVRIIRGRAEELAREESYREKFDIVLARAVTKFNILCELLIPFCRINGKIIFYKSLKVFDELKESRKVILKLGGREESLREVKVPYLNEFRAFLVIKKNKKSPLIYPRKFKKIKCSPLQ